MSLVSSPIGVIRSAVGWLPKLLVNDTLVNRFARMFVVHAKAGVISIEPSPDLTSRGSQDGAFSTTRLASPSESSFVEQQSYSATRHLRDCSRSSRACRRTHPGADGQWLRAHWDIRRPSRGHISACPGRHLAGGWRDTLARSSGRPFTGTRRAPLDCSDELTE